VRDNIWLQECPLQKDFVNLGDLLIYFDVKGIRVWAASQEEQSIRTRTVDDDVDNLFFVSTNQSPGLITPQWNRWF